MTCNSWRSIGRIFAHWTFHWACGRNFVSGIWKSKPEKNWKSNETKKN